MRGRLCGPARRRDEEITGTLAALAGANGLAAQARPTPPTAPRAERDECRCLDDAGRERERCFCFVMPDNFAGNLMGMPRRAVLGVNVRHDQPARYDEEGARLYGVDESSAAGEAGLEEGDILASVDGTSVLEPLAESRAEDRLSDDASLPVQRLLALLADREPGDSVRVEYLRDGERRTATVVLDEPRFMIHAGAPGVMGIGPLGRLEDMKVFGRDAAGGVNAFRLGDGCPGDREGTTRGRVVVMSFGRSCVAGVELLEMRAGLSEYFGAAEGGVLVADAREDNPLGLRPGDVLIAVDGREMRGVDQALRVLRSYEGEDDVDLRVLRKQQTLEVRGRVR
jgi:hypothetical protein